MTAEIAVLSRSAIALAADSAATYGLGADIKVFPSANKIFSLSKHHPVGIMIYGNAEFMGIPWETIIKHYREKQGITAFEDLPQFADAFIRFIREEKGLVPPADELTYAKNYISAHLSLIERDIRQAITKALEKKDDLTHGDVMVLVDAALARHEEHWMSASAIPEIPMPKSAAIRRKVRSLIDALMPEIFEKLLSTEQAQRLRNFAHNMLLHWPPGIQNHGTSGIVIAGFGSRDLFPRLRSYSIVGRFMGCLQFAERREHSVDISSETGEAIVPFAQTDVVQTFLEGVAPEYQVAIERGFGKILEQLPDIILGILGTQAQNVDATAINESRKVLKSALSEYQGRLREFRDQHYVQPVLSVLNGLPKDELAAMAESLVSLTSLRRRLSLDPDSVGGPIDVAVISRGDGFVWMKRKHYFSTDLNHHFLANLYRGFQK